MAETTLLTEELVCATGGEALVERAGGALLAPEGMGFRALFASVSRRLGEAAHSHPTPPRELGEAARPHWTLTDWSRLWLVLRALEHVVPEERAAFVQRTFEAGELGEQESVLRTLSLLPEPAAFVETGIAACRTNAKRVFEAIACDNPYPAAYFPELAYNQMVMKAVFVEAPVGRIEGLAARRTPELLRMARDYASERRAASRPVPADVALILGELS
ncbi:MAG TPA: EboA domain-containing protein [Polyangiaceae bacterium]|nr:EboA domain-containing protein [Polyangiaceae bacterium]